MMQDEAMKDEVLSYLLKYYKAELQERLGGTLPKIELHWDSGFERHLTEKKSKRITRRTLRDYKNIWDACLEGKVLGWHLLKQLEGKKMMCRDGKQHSTGWARQVFRHYIRYLYIQGKLYWDTYTRLLMVVPGRRYRSELEEKPIPGEAVIRTLKVLVENRPDIYLVYLLMLYSAVRFEHVLWVIKEWRPNELVYNKYLKKNITRLTCLDTHCRYYLQREGNIKQAAFMFFPKHLLPLIEEYAGRIPDRHRIHKVAVKKLQLLQPKLMRTYAMRLMEDVLGENDTYRFIISRFSEITTRGKHYMALLQKADKAYPRYARHVDELLERYKLLP